MVVETYIHDLGDTYKKGKGKTVRGWEIENQITVSNPDNESFVRFDYVGNGIYLLLTLAMNLIRSLKIMQNLGNHASNHSINIKTVNF